MGHELTRTKTLIQVASSFLLLSLLGGCGFARQIPTSNSAVNPTAPIPSTPVPALLSPTQVATPANTFPSTIIPGAQPSLRPYASQRDILIGAAVSDPPLFQDKLYAQTLSREFSLLVPENAMKFDAIHPSQNGYDFSEADAIVTFAKQNGMQVRGHTLVWGNQLPPWLIDGNFTRDEMIAILKDHIMTVVGHYRGQVGAWDVVNEAVDDNGSLKNTFWLKAIGPGYIDMAFTWAHEADPQAQLFYNDYGNEDLKEKSNAIYALVQGMLQRGVPINGVGFQMHLILDSPPRSQDVLANMKRLGVLGLEVHITEMDVRIQGTATQNDLAAQAAIYGNMLQACLSAKNCKAFVLWGFTDRHSWIHQAYPGYGSALIFDDSDQPKPAYFALLEALKGP